MENNNKVGSNFKVIYFKGQTQYCLGSGYQQVVYNRDLGQKHN